MSFLIGIILTLLLGVAVKVLGDDARSGIPKISTALIIRATKRLPAEHRGRWGEEWLAALGEMEERSAMLFHALSCFLIASPRLRAQLVPKYTYFGKRGLDLFILIAAAPVLLIFFGLYLIVVDARPKLTSRHYVGRGGRTFRVRRLLLPNTPIGRLCKKFDFDTIPILFNALNGDMSMVGPMPHGAEHGSPQRSHAYYQMRPGLVCFSSFPTWKPINSAEVFSDADHYASRMSLWTDLRLLFLTTSAVLGAPSASG
jgi:lipopolysaccharide/colanic/teichoic acid biosynthesis glycosyltransferase